MIGLDPDDILQENVMLRPFQPFGPTKCVSVNIPAGNSLYEKYVSIKSISNHSKDK